MKEETLLSFCGQTTHSVYAHRAYSRTMYHRSCSLPLPPRLLPLDEVRGRSSRRRDHASLRRESVTRVNAYFSETHLLRRQQDPISVPFSTRQARGSENQVGVFAHDRASFRYLHISGRFVVDICVWKRSCRISRPWGQKPPTWLMSGWACIGLVLPRLDSLTPQDRLGPGAYFRER